MENNDFWDFANDTVQEDMTLKTVYKAPYGTVYYKTSPSSSEVLSVDMTEINANNIANGSLFVYSGQDSYNRDLSFSVGSPAVTVHIGGLANTNVVVGIDLPQGLTKIKSYFMPAANYLEHIYIPNTVTEIEGLAFFNIESNALAKISLPRSVERIGNSFFARSRYNVASGFNATISAPGLKYIGDRFLNNQTSYSQDIDLPEALEIGNYFLGASAGFNYDYNSNINLPKVTKVGNCFIGAENSSSYYKNGCFNFSKNISLPNLEEAGNFFLARTMINYSQYDFAANLPKLKKVGNYFLYTADSGASYLRNYTLTSFTFPPMLEDVGAGFLEAQTKLETVTGFTQLKYFGREFMQNCTKFNGVVNLSNVVSQDIGDLNNFMYACSSMNSDIYFPTSYDEDYSYSRASGLGGILHECRNFNGHLYNTDKLFAVGDMLAVGNGRGVFNQPLDLSGLKYFPNGLLEQAGQFNQPIDLSNVVYPAWRANARTAQHQKVDRFMYTWEKFNSTITPPTVFPSGIDTLGVYTLYNCFKFNQSLTWLTSHLSYLSLSIMSFVNLTDFNQPLDFSNLLGWRGQYSGEQLTSFAFLFGLSNFESTIDMSNFDVSGVAVGSSGNKQFLCNMPKVKGADLSIPNSLFKLMIEGTSATATGTGNRWYCLCGTPLVSIPSGLIQSLTRIDCDVFGGPTSTAGPGINEPIDLSSITAVSPRSRIICNSTTFNSQLILPTITSINNILANSSAFNQPITIPEGVTSINEFIENNPAFNQPITFPSTLTTIGNSVLYSLDNFNQQVVVPEGVTSIGNYFLAYARRLNQPITLPSTLGTIGNGFCNGCSIFNQQITLPANLTSIGTMFLNSCAKFNQALELPSTLTSLGNNFLYDCRDMVSLVDVGSLAETVATSNNNTLATAAQTAASYTQGIPIKGANRAAWIARFPDRTSSPFRKLLDYGS